MPNHFLFGAAAFVLVASVLLGGGARLGLASDAILQLLSLPVLLLAAWRWLDLTADRRPRYVLPFLAAFGALFALQLMPLPPELWTRLPQREQLIEAFQLIDRPLPWMPLSVDPHFTRASLLAAIPPLAVFLTACCLQYEERRWLMLLLAPLAAVSVALGLLQLEQGPDSALRFYRPTNTGDAVGFFANRNHFSALLYCALLIAGAWTTNRVRRAGGVKALVADTRSFVTALAGVTTIIIVLCGAAISRSRAGVALTIVAAIGVYALGYDGWKTDTDSKVAKRRKQLALGVLAFGLLLQFPIYRALERFNTGLLEDARWTIARRALETAFAYFPFGSGIGSFVPVYAAHELPSDVLPDVYINHAHDDFLEVLLEGGVFGVAIVGGLLAWWGWTSLRLWRPTPGMCGDLYARAASLIVALLFAHSFVDYPLRSSAMMSVFALACAMLATPDEPTPLPEAPRVSAAARKRKRRSARARRETAPPPPPPPPPPPRGRVEEMQWPDEWTAR